MLALLLTVVATLVYGQVPVTYNIPFNFVVAGKTLPAGEYIVGHLNPNARSVVLIQDMNGPASLVTGTIPIGGGDVQEKSRLVFNHYGDQYFLSQTWTAQNATGGQFLPSKAEKRMALNLKQANGTEKPETVVVFAQPSNGGVSEAGSKR